MTTLHGRTALVLGGSAGIGLATVAALASEQVSVTAVARDADALGRVNAALGAHVTTHPGDATSQTFVRSLLQQLRPDIVVLSVGTTPAMGTIEQFTWDDFTAAWELDVKAAFALITAALALPLPPGSAVIVLSSGAALRGSPLSGGYAGAKRMQWFMTNYAQSVSDARQLGIRFVAVLPEQLVAGTVIGNVAASHYAKAQGITAGEFMGRYEAPLTPDLVAAAIIDIARGDIAPGATALGVKGSGSAVLS